MHIHITSMRFYWNFTGAHQFMSALYLLLLQRNPNSELWDILRVLYATERGMVYDCL